MPKSINTDRLMNPKVTTFSLPSVLLTVVSTKISFTSSLSSPMPKPNTLSSTSSPTKTSRLSQATCLPETRASELLSPGPLPTALFYAPRMDAAVATAPTDPVSKQQISISTSRLHPVENHVKPGSLIAAAPRCGLCSALRVPPTPARAQLDSIQAGGRWFVFTRD